MDYEKAYKEALERAIFVKENTDSIGARDVSDVIEYIFSELKEAEDEKIRKALVHLINEQDGFLTEINGISVKDILSWLEKQGKSKFEQCVQEGDKIVTNNDGTHFNVSQLERVAKKEPKFKIGDYLVNDYCKGKVIALTDDAYLLDTEQGIPFSCEHNAHLWTIRDAKDGDVLCGYPKSDYPWIGIFYKLNAKGTFNSYCYLQAGLHGKFCTPSGKNICGERNTDNHSSKDVIPATTEQRETLFKAMREAGYEWDAEKKELKKIEIITPLFNVGDTIIKKHNSDINDFGQFTITDITGSKYWYNDRIICDITEQDKWEFYEPARQEPVWSEEDDRNLSIAIQYVFQHGYLSIVDWLKSLKDRVQPKWKPSKEELNALDIAKDRNDKTGWHLCELYKQLKKL